MKSLILSVFLLAMAQIIVAQSTHIQVVAEPDISVFLDGIFKGRTTMEFNGAIIENIEPGSHLIKVVKEGYNPQEEVINVKKGEVYVYKVNPAFVPSIKITQKGNIGQQELDKMLGNIRIQSLPVEIFISIPLLGMNENKIKDEWTATALPVGFYPVTFTWKDKTMNDTVEVKSNMLTHLFVNMIRGTIEYRSEEITEPIIQVQEEQDAQEEISTPEVSNPKLMPFSILYSGSTSSPFGIKLQYCKSFGVYASFKTDFGLMEFFSIASGGILKSIWHPVAIYLGTGISLVRGEGEWFYREAPSPEFEGGIIFKLNRLALDVGGGLVIADNIVYDSGEIIDHNALWFSVTIGIGINF